MTGMVPEDVYELTAASDPRLTPDGSRCAYVVSRIDQKANDAQSSIWLATLDGSAPPRQLTTGGKHDAEPRWSPDGSLLAFTSDREGEHAQLYVLPLDGGDARKLTDHAESVSQPHWSPDGSHLVYVVRVPDAAYDEKDDRRRGPRRITRLQYKLESVGWTADRPQHLFVVPADGSASPRQLTDGDAEDASPAWSPDGHTVAFVSARHPFWDTEPVTDVYLVDAGGGEPRRLTQGGGSVDGRAWSPSGDRLALLRYPSVFDDPRHDQVALADLQTGELTVLTAGLDRNCTTYPSPRGPAWDGDELVFVVEDGGDVHLYRVAADGSRAPARVIGGTRAVTGYDVAAGVLVYTAEEPAMPAELFAAGDRMTTVTQAFTSGRELVRPERFTAASADGTEVEAWVVRPAGFEQGRVYPALLTIHGGPFTQYGPSFFDEVQVYAGAGYAVVFCNPRGSSGYSEAWGRAIRGPGAAGPGWGSVDFNDCMAVVDEAVRRFDFIDGDRLGVLGGSYGGFMTSWIVSHSDRFKAAISERAVNQFLSQWGSSDFGWDFKGYIGAFLFEDADAYQKMSPATYAASIHTPLLILHSEDDLRCPVEQAEQLFVTLRMLRREVEMVRFPAESHELTRSGSPLHRVQRFRLVLDWFDRHLKG